MTSTPEPDSVTRIANLERELEAFRREKRDLTTLLGMYIPSDLTYACHVANMGLAGFSVPYNGSIGGDLASPMVFPAPHDIDSFSLTPQGPQSRGVVRPIRAESSRIGFFMVDSMGHSEVSGVLAAMIYQSARVAAAYELAKHNNVSSQIARILNTIFYQGNSSASLPASLLLARFDREPSSSVVNGSYITAGNPFPVILRAGSSHLERFASETAHSSFPLGVAPTRMKDTGGEPENSFKPNKFKLDPGDIMVLYSDGLSDLGTLHKKPYFPSDARLDSPLLRLLLAHRTSSAHVIAQALAEDVFPYATRTDDLTAYVFKNEATPA